MCTLRISGRTNLFMVVSRATDATAAAAMSLGRLGSIIADIASPLDSTASEGNRIYGLIKNELLFLAGVLSNRDIFPLMWFVRHIGSPGLNPGG